MFRLFNNSLGVPIGTPFDDNRKSVGWEAGVGLLGGLVSGFTNLQATNNTNETNAAIAYETNKANQQINESQLAAARENWAREQANFEKQRQWSLDDRAFENEYNSPKALMQRYRQAGLNPYLMMDGQTSQASASGSTGQAPQFGSPPSPIPMQSGAPAVPPNLSGFGMGFSQAAQLAMAKDMNEAQISRIKVQNDLDAARLQMDGSKVHWENKQMEANFKRIMQDVAFNRETWQPRKDAIEFANGLVRANQAKVEAETRYQKLVNDFTPVQQDIIRKQGLASLDEIRSRIRANDAGAAYQAAISALTKSQEAGVKMDNAVKQEIASSLVDKALLDVDQAYWTAQGTAKKVYLGDYVGRMPDPKSIFSGDGSIPNYKGSHGGHRKLVFKDGKYQFMWIP